MFNDYPSTVTQTSALNARKRLLIQKMSKLYNNNNMHTTSPQVTAVNTELKRTRITSIIPTFRRDARWPLWPLYQPYALRFCAALARPHRSSSAPRSWRTGPSSWCIRHCGGPQSGCTLHLSVQPVLPVTHGSHTSQPHCWRKEEEEGDSVNKSHKNKGVRTQANVFPHQQACLCIWSTCNPVWSFLAWILNNSRRLKA